MKTEYSMNNRYKRNTTAECSTTVLQKVPSSHWNFL